jgi:hypothetical protein
MNGAMDLETLAAKIDATSVTPFISNFNFTLKHFQIQDFLLIHFQQEKKSRCKSFMNVALSSTFYLTQKPDHA